MLGRIDDRALRRCVRQPQEVSVATAAEGRAARNALRRPDFQAQDRGVLGGLAHAGARRRVPPGPLRRRDLARGTPGRADLLQRGSDGLVVHGAIRELEGVVGAHEADTGARRRGRRRRQRLRQGRARGLAPDQGAEMPVPRVRPGQEVHDDEAEAPGRTGAVPDRPRPHACSGIVCESAFEGKPGEKRFDEHVEEGLR